MKLDRITITGADSSNEKFNVFRSMSSVTMKYPYVEWGFLVTKEKIGNKPRFVNSGWISEAMDHCDSSNFSMHICGGYVRDMCRGEPSFLDDFYEHNMGRIDRIQLNLSCYLHLINRDRMLRAMKVPELEKKQFILQFSRPDFELLGFLRDAGVDAVPIFDQSGGKGKSPEEWPKASELYYNGYAGGLSLDNIDGELDQIAEAAGKTSIWIDIETGVRDSHNRFDFDLVEGFLKKCKPWMVPEATIPTFFCACGWSGKDIIKGTKEELQQAVVRIFGEWTEQFSGIVSGFCPNCESLFVGNSRSYSFKDEGEDEDEDENLWAK